MSRRKAVTLQVIADRLGITVHTVSKALRGLPGMSESTRLDILKTARELGYRTKAQAAGLSAEQIPWVGSGKPRRFVMITANDKHFFSLQIHGLNQRLHELGHVLSSTVLPKQFSHKNELMEWLERSGILLSDGLFLTPVLPSLVESALLRLPLPKIMINFPPDGAEVDSVIWDVQHAVHLSMNILYENGHRKILYFGDVNTHRGFQVRWGAFQSACARLQIPFVFEDHILDVTRTDREAILESLRDKLDSGGYTAILCAMNRDVSWVIMALQSMGYSVPGPISLIVMDHNALESNPNIARPIMLVRESAERAAELMLRRIANPRLPFEHVRLSGPFFTGSTISRVPGNIEMKGKL